MQLTNISKLAFHCMMCGVLLQGASCDLWYVEGGGLGFRQKLEHLALTFAFGNFYIGESTDGT